MAKLRREDVPGEDADSTGSDLFFARGAVHETRLAMGARELHALEEAVRIYVRYRLAPSRQPEAAFLAAHEPLRPLLERLLRGDLDELGAAARAQGRHEVRDGARAAEAGAGTVDDVGGGGVLSGGVLSDGALRDGALRDGAAFDAAGEPIPRDPTRGAPASPVRQVGPYRIERMLGEGGMGTVYLAEQTAPVRRTVALKVVRQGRRSREVMARFEVERQALALMNHPSIARVLDAGTTPEGEPYFVMEYVPGVPIHEYCEREALGVEARLRLFVQVCRAVQHAHQKAIIHRDLTPRNVLVATVDGEPVPKVIDFGLAKALGDELADTAYRTSLGMVLGTPAYMSPEQAGRDPGVVDTRTDVYALGAILYELLVGEVPFPGQPSSPAEYHEYLRRIREEDPPLPSRRLLAGGSSPAHRARRLGASRHTLQRSLERDLDWIILKALEKEPARRYAGVMELAADVQRFLEHEPVLASPPTAFYRLSKFVRKNRGVVLATSCVLVALVAGLAASLRFAYLAHDQSVQAGDAEREAYEQSVQARAAERVARENELLARQMAQEASESAAAAERSAEHARQSLELARANEAGWKQAADEARQHAAQVLREQEQRRLFTHMSLLPAHERLARELGPALPAQVGAMDLWLARADELLADEPGFLARQAELLPLLETSRVGGADPDALVVLREEERRLARHLDALKRFRSTTTWVRSWRDSAATLAARTIEGEALDAWREVLADLAPQPGYAGLAPQIGLVPLGRGPTGQWEFWHVQSGARPAPAPDAIDGWQLTEDTGIVLVLLPGIRTTMGSETPSYLRWEGLPHVSWEADPASESPVHGVTLTPYFIGKHELTQGQWLRITGRNPSSFPAGTSVGGRLHDLRHPVENISWEDAMAALERVGLTLPTEAQWECAARAGTTTPWAGVRFEADLWRYGNLADRTARNAGVSWFASDESYPGDDGHLAHAPVGSFAPNTWGLHDVHGNVWEWCRDWFGSYARYSAYPPDGQRLVQGGTHRVVRGGGFSSPPRAARCSHRGKNPPAVAYGVLGARAARAVTP